MFIALPISKLSLLDFRCAPELPEVILPPTRWSLA
jgi:hypothetical protein